MSVSESLGARKTIVLPQGQITYRETGEGDPVVFLHALLVNGDQWREVVPVLAGRVRCITPDIPFGAHEQPMADDADLSMPGVADLLVSFLDQLGIESATLVGSDAGGVLAQVMLARHPMRVSRIVLTCCDAYEDFPPKEFRILKYLPYIPGSLLLVARAMRRRSFRRSRSGFGLVMSADPPQEVLDSYLQPPLRRAIRRDLAKVLRAVSTEVTLAAASTFPLRHQPALILWAADDLLFDPSVPRRLAEDLPNSTLEIIDDSRIYIPEDAPAQLATAVQRFLEVEPPPHPARTGHHRQTRTATRPR